VDVLEPALWSHDPVSDPPLNEWTPLIRTGFESVVIGAGLGSDVTPHVLRHTTAT